MKKGLTYMQIEDIVLRTKAVELLNSPVPQMGIEITNPNAKIINREDNSVFVLKDFILRIVDKKNNKIIANLKLIFQIKLALIGDETFSDSEFAQLIIPVIYLQINNMLAELFLPRLEYKQFLNILQKNS